MKKSHESGVATHIGPESCGAAREGGVEALTGDRAGRVFSRVRISLRDADGFGIARCRGAARTVASSGIVCGASSLAGCLCLLSVIPIPCAAWASLPKARAGKSACPDPWRGL